MKRAITCSIFFCTIIFNLSISMAGGLVAYYPFYGNANDESGNGYHGIVYGAALVEDRNGVPNSAYSFNGTSDYIFIQYSEDLQFDFPVSILAYVKIEEHNGAAIFTNNFIEDRHSGVWLNFTSSGYAAINYGSNGIPVAENRRTKIGQTQILSGEWYCITGIVKNNDEMEIYVNGENDGGYYTGTGTELGYGDGAANIGRKDGWLDAPPAYVNGVVDEVYFYNKALTDEEVRQAYANSVPVELSTFNASVNNNQVYLAWQTQTETNNYGFKIERCNSGDWENIGFIKGQGTTTKVQEYQFIDDLSSLTDKDKVVKYRLKQIDFDGAYEYSKEVTVNVEAPHKFKLFQNYPNPFNPETNISFSVQTQTHVSIVVYNLNGKIVEKIFNGEKEPGLYNQVWNASGKPSGVYFIKLITNENVQTKKCLFLK